MLNQANNLGAQQRMSAEVPLTDQLELDRIYDRLGNICQALFGATMSLDNTAHAVFGGISGKGESPCTPVPSGALAKIHERLDTLDNLTSEAQNLAVRYSNLAA